MEDIRANKLGMSAGKAYNRLLKDIMWWLIVESGKHKCCRCGNIMGREDFSIEHIEQWLNSEDPYKYFFSLDNIGFSHLKCNMENKRSYGPPSQAECGTSTKYERGCRCDKCREASSTYRKSIYTIEKRRKKWIKNKH